MAFLTDLEEEIFPLKKVGYQLIRMGDINEYALIHRRRRIFTKLWLRELIIDNQLILYGALREYTSLKEANSPYTLGQNRVIDSYVSR